jgi:hypothetical protein
MIDPKPAAQARRLKLALDAGFVVGTAVFLYGLHLWWRPLPFIVGGVLLSGACFLGGYDAFRKTTIERMRNGGR